MPQKNDIIRELQRQILPLEGYSRPSTLPPIHLGLPSIEKCFPEGVFPTGAIHDFISADDEQDAATCAFIAAVLGRLMDGGGVAVWIGTASTVFAAGLAFFGIEPHRIIFVDPTTDQKTLWVMEESLRCDRFVAVVGEIRQLSFIASRRLQLAVEQSRVTGFLLRRRAYQNQPVASAAQWRITGIPTQSQGDRPGRGFPSWKVELLKIKNSQPFACEIEWIADKFNPVEPNLSDESNINKTA